MWKFYACDWFVDGRQSRVVRYNSMTELLNATRGYRNWDGQHHRNAVVDKLFVTIRTEPSFGWPKLSESQ